MITRTTVCTLLSFWLTGLAGAQTPEGDYWDEQHGPAESRYERHDDGSRWALRGGLGFTAGPSTFLMAFEAPYSLTSDLTLGPLLQIGVDGALPIPNLIGYPYLA